MSKGHCKIPFEQDEDQDEVAEFYEYGGEDDDGWQDQDTDDEDDDGEYDEEVEDLPDISVQKKG